MTDNQTQQPSRYFLHYDPVDTCWLLTSRTGCQDSTLAAYYDGDEHSSPLAQEAYSRLCAKEEVTALQAQYNRYFSGFGTARQIGERELASYAYTKPQLTTDLPYINICFSAQDRVSEQMMNTTNPFLAWCRTRLKEQLQTSCGEVSDEGASWASELELPPARADIPASVFRREYEGRFVEEEKPGWLPGD